MFEVSEVSLESSYKGRKHNSMSYVFSHGLFQQGHIEKYWFKFLIFLLIFNFVIRKCTRQDVIQSLNKLNIILWWTNYESKLFFTDSIFFSTYVSNSGTWLVFLKPVFTFVWRVKLVIVMSAALLFISLSKDTAY